MLFLLLCFWLLGKRREMFSHIFLSNSNILIILTVTYLDNFITYYDKVFCLFGFWFGATHAMLVLKSECSQGLLLIRLWGSYIVPRMDSTQAHARPYSRYYLSCPIWSSFNKNQLLFTIKNHLIISTIGIPLCLYIKHMRKINLCLFLSFWLHLEIYPPDPFMHGKIAWFYFSLPSGICYLYIYP